MPPQTVAMTGSGRAAKVDVRPEDSVGRMAELVAEAGCVDLLVE